MTLLFAGYFPKRIVRRDPWLAAPHVDEIWSVSECMSKGPRGWIDRWRHNDFWLFDSVGLAESVVPEGERSNYRVLGYRVWDHVFDAGRSVPLLDTRAPKRLPEPEAGLRVRRVGFDAVSRSYDTFDHSPLSCNAAAVTFPSNESCLFRTLDDALVGAERFSHGTWEPGTYWVVEVLDVESTCGDAGFGPKPE